jgi:predicted NBD/HSP70 family sugar kinase
MRTSTSPVVVGLDNGGNVNNATVLETSGRFLVGGLVESPSLVREGPDIAIDALARTFDDVLAFTGTAKTAVLAVGLDTPGPASAEGVISSRGSTNFAHPAWRSFDVRGAVEDRLQLPVIYNNDGNAAALYAHHMHFGSAGSEHSSIAAIVGTGLGGGVIEAGQVVKGASGMAGELGHVHIPMSGMLADDQPMPRCNCGFVGDAESIASLTGIENNLLPYWLTRSGGHPLGTIEVPGQAARQVRAYAEAGDEMALTIFEQQAMALGRLFTIAANYTDPSVYFVGGGVVESTPAFRDWFMGKVREHTVLREEQAALATFAVVPDLDMAGARGAALAALASLQARSSDLIHR